MSTGNRRAAESWATLTPKKLPESSLPFLGITPSPALLSPAQSGNWRERGHVEPGGREVVGGGNRHPHRVKGFFCGPTWGLPKALRGWAGGCPGSSYILRAREGHGKGS